MTDRPPSGDAAPPSGDDRPSPDARSYSTARPSPDALPSPDARRRKESFDEVAELYDLYRPPLPGVVAERLVSVLRAGPGVRVLEIACGAGRISVPIVRAGAELVGVDLGGRLVEIARQRLSEVPDARFRIDVAPFESWDPPAPEAPFDAAVCAVAFHWLDREVAYPKIASLLRPGGVLALLNTHHVRGGTPGLVERSQPIYIRWGLSDDPFFQPTTAADAPLLYGEIDDLPEFGPLERWRHEEEISFTTETYVGLLQTDSVVNGADDTDRAGFLRDMRELLDTEFGGRFTRNYLHEIVWASRI
ncbi:MAG TPA: class I SAM-dependent methyltransferase [Acidimicrobiales bacterium]|nr:class I SAM-dependent methyltransferase [Acidimicrobiales bacterium]